MTLKEIADALIAGCRDGSDTANLETLYAPDAVSVEAIAMGEQGRETHGLDGIRGKHAWWEATFEVIEMKIGDPMRHGDNSFATTFEVKTRNKETGEVEDMSEIAVYHVADGKIVREEFFYAAW